MLRLSMVNIKDAVISNLFVNGTIIKTVNYQNVFTADCTYKPQNNGFTYHSDKPHGYIVFRTALKISGEKFLKRKIKIFTTFILGIFISTIILILISLSKKFLSVKIDKENKYERL